MNANRFLWCHRFESIAQDTDIQWDIETILINRSRKSNFERLVKQMIIDFKNDHINLEKTCDVLLNSFRNNNIL